MTTKHHFTHEDGNTSTRTSANRVYPFAVEVGPQTIEAKIAELEAVRVYRVAYFEKYDAIKTEADAYAHALAGLSDYQRKIGANVHVLPLADYAEFAANEKAKIEKIDAMIAELRASGRTHTEENFFITTWCGSAVLAEKALRSLQNQDWTRGRVLRVVETVYETK